MKAKKSLGQNFLKSEPALKKIIKAGEIKPTDVVLEIGPGKGVLTKKLMEKAGLVISIEKDRELFDFLKEKFKKEITENPPSHKDTDRQGKLILKNEDILDFSIEQNIPERTLGGSDGDGQRKFSTENFRGESGDVLRKYKIIANIPYNITGAILKKFLTEKNQPVSMTLMVQHEVAKRIIARDGKESILSLSVKAYGEPKLIMKVPARYFSPAPKVDSAIISINNISRKTFTENNINEEKFWELVKTGFAHKRKLLASNLKPLLGNNVSQILEDKKIKRNSRAEDLSLKGWLNLTKKIF